MNDQSICSDLITNPPSPHHSFLSKLHETTTSTCASCMSSLPRRRPDLTARTAYGEASAFGEMHAPEIAHPAPPSSPEAIITKQTMNDLGELEIVGSGDQNSFNPYSVLRTPRTHGVTGRLYRITERFESVELELCRVILVGNGMLSMNARIPQNGLLCVPGLASRSMRNAGVCFSVESGIHLNHPSINPYPSSKYRQTCKCRQTCKSECQAHVNWLCDSASVSTRMHNP